MRIPGTPAELESLRGRPRRLLAVFPHPDDEAYGAAGALARAGRDPGAAAVLLCLTRGEASSMGREQATCPSSTSTLVTIATWGQPKRSARMVPVAPMS